MNKVIAAFNMTLDGVCDHTTGVADGDLHRHYADLINDAGMLLYGRITYQLMQYWQNLLNNPSGEPSMDEFALSIDRVPKLVFSNTLQNTGWESAKLAQKSLAEEVTALKQAAQKDILVGSRSLIIQLLENSLVDEFQLCIHPVIEGKGLKLFDQLKNRVALQLVRSKQLKSGAIVLYYLPIKNH